jgi:GNAT superfamily N-acetyltransferase
MNENDIPVVNIRPGEIDDCWDIGKVQVDSYKKAYAGIFPKVYLDRFSYDEQKKDWRTWFSSRSGEILFVAAIQAEEIVGYALGRPSPGGIDPFDSELIALHVTGMHQGRGIGQRLFVATAEALKLLGCNSLMLWTTEANPVRAWYEHLGGALIGTKAWGGNPYYGVDVNEVAYGWADIEDLTC